MSEKIFCPSCGVPNTADSNFCSSCGASLPLLTEITPHPPTITVPPSPPPPLPPPMTYEQPRLLPDGEPVLNKTEVRLHRLWQEKRFNELLAAWELKVADAEKNAAKGTGLPIALIIIGLIALGGFVGIIILIAGLVMYSRRTSARKNLSEYHGVLFYLRDYGSKYGIVSTTHL